MNLRAILIGLLIIAAFLLGWASRRFTTVPRQQNTTQPSVATKPPALPDNPTAAPTNQSPTATRPQPTDSSNNRDRRMSRVAEILDRRDQQIADLKRRASGFETEADRREIARINQEADDQINALLSDGEHHALQIEKFKRTDLGKALIEHFAATPDELAAISDYEKDLAELIATPGGDLEGVQSRNLAKLKTIIGEARTDEFMNYRDPDYVEALAFLKRFNLRPETARDLFKIRYDHGKIMLERLKQNRPSLVCS